MNEKPILFNGPMVRALLDGLKTQTRRVAKLTEGGHLKAPNSFRRWHPADQNAVNACPYGKPGDRLWVRESFSYHEIPEGEPYFYPEDRVRECVNRDYGVHYWADGDPEWGNWTKPKPSIHMPRWASRITLEITDVRVERLQEISEEDARAEGAPRCGWDGEVFFADEKAGSYKVGFAELWYSINKKHPWESNPWVWVVEFKRLQENAS